MLIPFKRLPTRHIRGIIHIGAHEAEELRGYLNCGKTRVLWVEANPAKASLVKDKIKDFPDMEIGCFAANEKSGSRLCLNIASNTQSSSLLSLGTHKDRYADIQYTNKIFVDSMSIDDWLEQLAVNRHLFNFLNLDIQGYELNALLGAAIQLEFIDFIYIEVNFEEVYIGCPSIDSIDLFLSGYGFKRIATKDTGEGWGDALYCKRSAFATSISFFLYSAVTRIKTHVKRAYSRIRHFPA